MTKEKYLFVPQNLDLESLLPQREYKRHADKYKYFVHLLHEKKVLDKTIREDWVALHSEAIRDVLTSRHDSKIIKFFKSNGIVECDESYSTGGKGIREGLYDKKCKWYRLAEDYKGVKTQQHMILDEDFAAKLNALKEEELRQITQPHLQFLLFNLNELKIDLEGAILAIGRQLKADGNIDKYNSDTIAAINFYKKNIHFVRDDKGKRVHNNITNLSKTLRKFLYLETGEELVNLDVRNSQPLLLSILLKKEYGSHMPLDALQYIQLCEEGRFYEEMMMLLNEPVDTDRGAFKERVFGKIFYCRNSEHYQYKESKVFQERFPSCYAVIKKLKQKDYTQLSIQMQKIEADIVIEGCVGKIASLRDSDFFALTVHDSIITSSDKAEWVKELMQAEFAKYGIYPTINIETLK